MTEVLRKYGTPGIFFPMENEQGILCLYEFIFAYIFQDVTSEYDRNKSNKYGQFDVINVYNRFLCNCNGVYIHKQWNRLSGHQSSCSAVKGNK